MVCRTAAGEETDRTEAPYFFVSGADKNVDALPLKSSHADVEIDGVIAEVTLEQVYENNGSRPLEAVYVFPASSKAAVHAMEMTVGERTIRAKIEPTRKAEKQYEEARSQGKTASLLTQKLANVFQMKVANILPGDRIVVMLSYTELITPTDKVYEFVLPTTVGPRYTGNASAQDASAQESTESWTHSPYLHEGEAPPFDFDADIRIESPLPLMSVGSPSHHLHIEWPTPTSAELSLTDTDGANRDLIVRYRLAGDTIQSGLLTYKGEKENYFLLMTAPPARAKKNETVAREHLFVVDVSGSMNGFPLETAKTLMRDILAELDTSEYFNVLLFSSGKELFSPKSVRATSGQIEKAQSWLSSVSGGGGTELLPALEAVAALPKAPSTSRIITVITDGYVAVEAEAYRLIRKNLDSANLFAFGIGSSVNRELIEVMARAGRGEPFIVTNPEAARKTAARYRTYVDAPLLRNIQVAFDGFDATEVEPLSVPDLFSERPIVLFGKYRGSAKGNIILRGMTASGAYEESISVSDAQAAQGSALSYLWARSRIRTLADEDRLARAQKNKAKITKLGLAHHLMTSYTSFIAVDDRVRNRTGDLDTKAQPSAMPQGVSDAAIGNPENVYGALMGNNFGFGGLSITGTGRGGGGVGYGTVGLGKLNTIGHGGGGAGGSGYGRGARGLGGRRTHSVRIRSKDIQVKGGLSSEIIRRIVHRHMNELKFCYEKAIQAHPSLKGTVTLHFTIRPDGTVNDAVAKSDIKDKALKACLAASVNRWTFPAPQGGGIVKVRYPLVFEP